MTLHHRHDTAEGAAKAFNYQYQAIMDALEKLAPSFTVTTDTHMVTFSYVLVDNCREWRCDRREMDDGTLKWYDDVLDQVYIKDVYMGRDNVSFPDAFNDAAMSLQQGNLF